MAQAAPHDTSEVRTTQRLLALLQYGVFDLAEFALRVKLPRADQRALARTIIAYLEHRDLPIDIDDFTLLAQLEGRNVTHG